MSFLWLLYVEVFCVWGFLYSSMLDVYLIFVVIVLFGLGSSMVCVSSVFIYYILCWCVVLCLLYVDVHLLIESFLLFCSFFFVCVYFLFCSRYNLLSSVLYVCFVPVSIWKFFCFVFLIGVYVLYYFSLFASSFVWV